MKKTTVILLIVWVGFGCGTIKDILSKDSEPDFPTTPDPKEVVVDENGNPIFSQDQLNGKKSFNWTLAFTTVGFLIASALLVRRAMKND
jgi:hypothetical protein